MASNTHSTLQQVSIPSRNPFQEKLVPKMKNSPNAMKFSTQSRSTSLIINMIIEIADRDLGRFGLKIAIRLILMKFDTQNKLSMLIMNVLIGVDGLDLKLKIYEIYEIFLLKSEMCSNFFEIWHLEQF